VQTIVRGEDGRFHLLVKLIERVHKDDLVLARDEKTGRTSVRRVMRTTVRHVDKVLTVALADAKTHKVVERITATREHPFYVRGKGFTPAGGLAVGNAIVTRAGPALMVQSVSWHRRAVGYSVFNLQIEDDHSYFAGTANGGTWVHNADYDQALALGRGMNSSAWTDMYAWLLRNGFRPRQIVLISDPTEYAQFMDRAGSIHFNLADTSAEFLSDQTRYTAQEWTHLLDNPQLWEKSTVYNPPDNVTVPPGIRVGPRF